MHIAFYYISLEPGPRYEIPNYISYSLASIRKFMPDATITQATNYETPAIPGVDRVARFKSDKILNRETVGYIGCGFLSQLNYKEMIFIDPDMMFNANVEHLFDGDFDISVATRMKNDPMKEPFRSMFPYNSLVAVKGPAFWKDCYHAFLEFDVNWWTSMEVLKMVIDSGKYKVRRLPGEIYNHIDTNSVDDFDRTAKVFHFKGNETVKAYMKPFYERYIADGE
jgi:hypothetical protein